MLIAGEDLDEGLAPGVRRRRSPSRRHGRERERAHAGGEGPVSGPGAGLVLLGF